LEQAKLPKKLNVFAQITARLSFPGQMTPHRASRLRALRNALPDALGAIWAGAQRGEFSGVSCAAMGQTATTCSGEELSCSQKSVSMRSAMGIFAVAMR
jgi:hypothetical protein